MSNEGKHKAGPLNCNSTKTNEVDDYLKDQNASYTEDESDSSDDQRKY